MKPRKVAPHGQGEKGGVTDARDTRARASLVAEICERLSQGESLTGVFDKPKPGYPNIVTFWRWTRDDPEVCKLYDDATAARSERYAEEIAAIADEEPEYERTQFGEKRDQGFIAWQKNRIDARKWIASKLTPKKYGDRTVIAGDADNPLIVIDDPKAVLARRLAANAAAAGASGSDRGTD